VIVYKLVFGFDQIGEHGNLVREFHHRKQGKMKPKKHEATLKRIFVPWDMLLTSALTRDLWNMYGGLKPPKNQSKPLIRKRRVVN